MFECKIYYFGDIYICDCYEDQKTSIVLKMFFISCIMTSLQHFFLCVLSSIFIKFFVLEFKLLLFVCVCGYSWLEPHVGLFMRGVAMVRKCLKNIIIKFPLPLLCSVD